MKVLGFSMGYAGVGLPFCLDGEHNIDMTSTTTRGDDEIVEKM